MYWAMLGVGREDSVNLVANQPVAPHEPPRGGIKCQSVGLSTLLPNTLIVPVVPRYH